MAGTDLISRGDAIEAICKEFRCVYCWNCANQDTDNCEDCHRKYMNWSISRETVESVINGLPTAERKGHWVVRHPMRYDGKFVGADTDIIPDTRIRHLYCGECDKQMPIFEKFPYCPYCGARMVSKDAE